MLKLNDMTDHPLLQISGDCPYVVLSAVWVWLGNTLWDNAREISTGSQHSISDSYMWVWRSHPKLPLVNMAFPL